MSTTEAEHKELVRDCLKAMDAGEIDRLDEYLAEDYVGHSPATEDFDGRADFKAFVAMFDSAFPDAEHVIEDVIAEGHTVCHRSRLTGTHEGEFMGIEPTGNEIEVPGIVISRIEGGTIAEQWVQTDMMGMMEQLGVQ